jgi:hypothetical protein
MSNSDNGTRPTSNSRSFIQYLWGKPGTLRFALSAIATLVVVIAMPLSVAVVRQQQTIFSQASACNEETVDTEFRLNADASTPWKSGNSLHAKVGDVLDVNCFAKTGSALLTNATMIGKVDGETIDLHADSAMYDGAQLRGLTIERAGRYEFTCKNNRCSNKDSFTVAGASPSPTPSVNPSPSSSPVAGCTTFSESDLNEDCRSTVEDYDIFLRDFIEQQD